MTSSDSSRARTPFYFTVDFEDIGADMLRGLGLDDSARAREDILWRTYADIQAFVAAHMQGRPVTYFCTGVLGRFAPSLIRQIAADGNEIACHYNFHDAVRGDAPDEVKRQVGIAIDSLEIAGQSAVEGFRAPMFSISADNVEQYQALASRFRYDSSLIADVVRGFDEADYAHLTRNGAMRLFPVPMIRKGRIRHKAGGTFFKFFPTQWSDQALAGAHRAGLPAVFYIHPYEFTRDARFMLGLSQLKGLGAFRGAYWWARQSQWHLAGNAMVPSKLAELARRCEHQGAMRDLLATAS